MLTIILLAFTYNWHNISFWKIWVFRDRMREKESCLIWLIESDNSFWMCWCWTCLIIWFFIIPSYSTVLSSIEWIKSICKRWLVDINHWIVILKFTCLHCWVIVTIRVSSIFGRYFNDNPPSYRLIGLAHTAKCCHLEDDKGWNKNDHNKTNSWYKKSN